MTLSVAIIAPGAMGSAVAGCLTLRGAAVRTMLEGRSADSLARARRAGMEDATPETITACDIILSIVPPGQAIGLARQLAPALAAAPDWRKPVFADCNAVCPATMAEIAAVIEPTGCALADGAIIGPPPVPGAIGTRLYLSGPGAVQVARVGAYGIEVVGIEGGVGAASALKMAYAGITKGLTALGATMMLAAETQGTGHFLRAELAASQPALFGWLTRQMPKMPDKAYRWVAEMEEVASFIPDALPGPAIYGAIAQFYRAIAQDQAIDGPLVEALATFCKARPC